MARSTTPPARAWPSSFGPPRTCTATPPCCSTCAPPTDAPWLCTAIASASLSATIPTGPSPNNCAAPRTPRTSGASCRSSASASSPPTPLRPRAASSASGKPSTIAAANAFLPAFLADLTPRFARAPADATAAWRPAPRDLTAVLSCRYTRVVAHDNTVRLGPRWVQLPRRRAYTGRRLELRECLDGRLLVVADGHCLATQPAPAAEFILRPRHGPSADRGQRLRASQRRAAEGGRYPPLPQTPPLSSRTPTPAAARKPSPTHPWRQAAPYSTRSRGMTFSRNS